MAENLDKLLKKTDNIITATEAEFNDFTQVGRKVIKLFCNLANKGFINSPCKKVADYGTDMFIGYFPISLFEKYSMTVDKEKIELLKSNKGYTDKNIVQFCGIDRLDEESNYFPDTNTLFDYFNRNDSPVNMGFNENKVGLVRMLFDIINESRNTLNMKLDDKRELDDVCTELNKYFEDWANKVSKKDGKI